ncbi:MAG: peptidoglycan-binding domain-containing protein [Reyranellaceae bacterium]
MADIGIRLAGLAAVVAGAFVLAAPALASDAKGNYAIRGVGSQDCKTLTERLSQDKDLGVPLASWMLGYMSAVNRYEPTTFDIAPITDVRALTNIAVALCTKHPTARFEVVLADMLRALSRARVRADSPVVEMKSGEATANLRQETLLLVQQRLNERGILKGKPDGTYGPQTEAALKDYQKAEKLPVTGVADSATVVRLLIEQAPKEPPPKAPAPKKR